MKTSFVPDRGHNYHVVHETNTGGMRRRAYTLCGEFFEGGELSTHQPTCPSCKRLDNPLLLGDSVRDYLSTIIDLGKWRDAPKAREFHKLKDCDYIDVNFALTRRGGVLAQDFTDGAVPLADTDGVVHARKPLDMYPLCQKNGRLAAVNEMSLSRYEKLRKLEATTVVTCLACLGK